MVRQVTRIGVYGVALRDRSLLLTMNKSGFYKGLLSLPGGGVEFGETAEETLRREFKEEVAMSFKQMKLLDNLSFFGQDSSYAFHHMGQIYQVDDCSILPDIIAEEQHDWYPLNTIDLAHLVPFSKIMVQRFRSQQ